MVEESSPLLPPAEESIEAETVTALEPEPESGKPTPEPTRQPDFLCACGDFARSACTGEPFYAEQEGLRYCVLHFPDETKRCDFDQAFKRKLDANDFNFRGVWFPDDLSFDTLEFKTEVDFGKATFNSTVQFSKTNFYGGADFSYATLEDAALFNGARFGAKAYFGHATFADVVEFSEATFDWEAYFTKVNFNARAYFLTTRFREVDFAETIFLERAEFVRARFDGLANFASATFRALANFREATFSADADFSEATFSADAYFVSSTFSADAYFVSSTFSADAHFRSATFSAGADFRSATFSADADFLAATFSADAYFFSATFSADVDFSSATFSAFAGFNYATFSAAADFSYTSFGAAGDFNLSVFHARADFSRASFNDSIHFFGSATDRLLKDGTSVAAMALGRDPSLDFQHVRIEHPERIAFHTLTLRPHWFVNVDSRQFVFTDVGWEWEGIKQEIAALEANRVSSPNRLLAIACRQLAENAEANNRYEEASRFRYWAMDLARRTKWKRSSFWKTDWLHMLYWAVSGYGERILRPLGVLAAVWILFVLLYTRVGFAQQPPKASKEGPSSATAESMIVEDKAGRPLEFSRALTYSLAVMSLQKPEPQPLTNSAHTLVTLETILGPVQAALLALAIRRKFMR